MSLLLPQLSLVGATLKVVQMLQHFEHVAPVFVEAVGVWIKEYGMKSIVGELLRWERLLSFFPPCSRQLQPLTLGSLFREIGQKCPQELSRDASGVKGYAAFLVELAGQAPAIVLANISVLLHHLDGEVLNMRPCEMLRLHNSPFVWPEILSIYGRTYWLI